MRRARWLLVTALLVEAVVLGGGAVLGRPLPLAAQTPPAGTIEGELRPPEAWLVDLDGVPIEVIGLTEDGDIATYEGLTQQAHFAVAVPADPGTTYLVRATIGGVAYFALSVVLLSSDLPTAEVEIAVYPTTTEAPPLRIAATTVTMLALDRAAGEITFVREDVVVNPSTSTYVAAEDGSTARLPLLEASLAADGAASYLGIPVHGAFTLDGARTPQWRDCADAFFADYEKRRSAFRVCLAEATRLGDERITLFREVAATEHDMRVLALNATPGVPASAGAAGWLGVEAGNLSKRRAEEMGLTSRDGAYVKGTKDASPARKAGIRDGDVIVRVGRSPIASKLDLSKASARYRAGQILNVDLLRGGEQHTLYVAIEARPMK